MTGRAEKILSAVKGYGDYFVTWLLSAVSVSAVLSIYTDEPLNVFTLASAAASAVLICFFTYLRSKKLGGLVYLATLITVCIMSSMPVSKDWDVITAFVKWFFSGAQAEETRADFMLALTSFMTFFLTSAFYYFTRIIYRSSMLALASLIPFALAVKTASQLSDIYIMTIASLNLVLLIADGRKTLLNRSAAKGSAAGYIDFAAAAVLLAFILPKPTDTPFYDKFEAAVNMFIIGGNGEDEYRGEYKSESGNADELVRGESRLIYALSTTEPVYMKTQAFDLYDPGTGRWVPMDKNVKGLRDWEEGARLHNFGELDPVMKQAAEKTPRLAEEYPFMKNVPGVSEEETFAVVYSRDYPARYIIAPLRATGVSISVTGAERVFRSDAGEIFTSAGMLPPNVEYSVKYYGEDIFDERIQSGACNVSFEDYGNCLWSTFLNADSNWDVISEFYKEYNRAVQYKELTRTEVSDEIQALADEITEGLQYDYEKAEAIEQFFHSGDFVYSLAYEPPEGMDTPEWFLFESKTGICTDFATAYTLLARAAGLTVRYAEGFVPIASQTPNVYFIFTDNAHAYPEVYVPGAGWVIYEPTVSDNTGGSGRTGTDGRETDYTAVFLTAVVFVCGMGAFILLVFITPKFTERIFRMRVKRIKGSKAVIMLYNRYIINAENSFGISCKALTPEQAAETARLKTGLSLEPLTKPFIAACYGEADIDGISFENAYDCYKEQYKAMRNTKWRSSK